MRNANYQPYPEYDESGVEWVGKSPAGWDVLPFFVHAAQCKRSNKGMVNDNLLSLSFGRVIRKNIETSEGLLPESFETYQIVEPDDVVFRLTDLQNDKRSLRSALCSERGIITSAYLAAQPVGIEARYLAYLMRSYDHTKVLYALGSGLRQSLKYSDMKRLPVLVPSRVEQTQIAKFLDYETAKIDARIEKQQQLIALLKEKRQAVISHAVTKGLNPDAPMRDSGVEWLGEVPAHWRVGGLGYYANLNTGATPDRSKPSFWSGDIPWVKTGEVNYDAIYRTEEQITDAGVRNSAVRLSPPGTLLMAMYGQGVTRGRVAILGIPATYNQACVAINPASAVTSAYLRYFFMSAYHAIRDGGNVTSQMNLNADIVKHFKVSIPTLDEQTAIVNYLDDELPRFDLLLEKSESVIQLMNERRTGLISSAVTGKIDVRGWKPPESKPEPEAA